MSSAIQRRRGTTAQHATFAGLNAELTIDTDKEVVVVHDGTTAGGYPLMRENGSNSALALGSAATPSLKFTGDPNTGLYSPGADQVALATNGTQRLAIDSSGNISIPGALSTTGTINATIIKAGTGLTQTAANPTYSFSNAPTTGLYSPGGGLVIATEATARMWFSVPGNIGIHELSPVSALQLGSGAFSVPLGTAAAPSVTFNGDINTGIYSPGADQVAISTGGTGRLYIAADGKVGIGVASPQGLLHLGGTGPVLTVTKNVSGTDNILYYDNSTANNDLYIGRDSSNLIFRQANNERMRIDSSGRLGVGTSSVSDLLQVGSSTNRGTVSVVGTSTSTPYIKLDYTAAASGRTYGLLSGSSANGNFDIYDFTASAYRLTIDSSGRVGIGTTSPDHPLVVQKDSGATEIVINAQDGTSTANLRYRSAGTTIAQVGASGSNLLFSIGTNERARIDSSGRLLVGTSTAVTGANASISKLNVIGNSSNSAGNAVVVIGRGAAASTLSAGNDVGGIFFTDNGSNEFAAITCQADAATGAADAPGRLVFATTADGAASPTERLRISSTGRSDFFADTTVATVLASAKAAGTSNYLYVGRYGSTGAIETGTTSFLVFTNGNVQNTNNSYGAISDIKLKENIVDANSQWSDLKSLQVRNYNLKEGQTHTQIGLVAQEVELVSPGLVSECPDRDEEGNDLGTVTKSVNYSVLYMKAVKALQEAMERIETLEARLTAAGIE